MFKYGTVEYAGAKSGDPVRYVEGPRGKTGSIMRPRGPHEINAILTKVIGNIGYAEIKPSSTLNVSVGASSGSASVIPIHLPITAGGSLRVK